MADVVLRLQGRAAHLGDHREAFEQAVFQIEKTLIRPEVGSIDGGGLTVTGRVKNLVGVVEDAGEFGVDGPLAEPRLRPKPAEVPPERLRLTA